MFADMIKQSDPVSIPLLDGFKFKPPTISLDGDLTIRLGELTFELLSVPGHTPQQLAVYIPEEKILFMGDNVVRQIPFIPPDALPFDWMKSLKRLQKLDVDVVVPGHGEIVDKKYLNDAIKGVKVWIDAVSEAINKGMSLEEAQKSIDLLDMFPKSHLPVERQIDMQRRNIVSVYTYLTTHKK